jgi:uncharacterized integral membrane protein
MATLLVTVALGVAFAIFSTQNTEPVSVNLVFMQIPAVPLFLVVLIPLLVGLLTSFLIHSISSIASSIAMDEHEREIKGTKEENAELAKRVHKLELENTKLKAKLGEEFDEESF